MGAFDEVVVCVPTVRERADVLAETLAQWRRFGVAPVVESQPDDWPLGAVSQRRTADCALRRALDERQDASHVLYTEDDIDLAPDLDVWLPALCWLGGVATLYLSGMRHYPSHIRKQMRSRTPIEEGIIQLTGLKAWWGTLAILLPRDIAEALLCWESGQAGWDVQLNSFLRAHEMPVFAAVPNPVQHRGAPTMASAGGELMRSLTFGRPSTRAGVSPAPTVRPAMQMDARRPLHAVLDTV